MMSKPFLVIIKLGCFADIRKFKKRFTSIFFGNFLIFGEKDFLAKKNLGNKNKLLVKIFWSQKNIGQNYLCRKFFLHEKLKSEIIIGKKK